MQAEGSLLRAVKVVFLGLSLFSLLVIHLPVLPLPVQATAHAFANMVGQEQRWRMFSADPPGPSFAMVVVLVDRSGRSRTWSIDRRRPGGDLAYYHWVKWMETAVLKPEQVSLEALAEWLIAESEESVSEVVVYGQITHAGKPPGPRGEPEVITLFRTEVKIDEFG
jgi:hypothetical protein